MMRQAVELAVQRAAPHGQPTRRLLRVVGEDGYRPRTGLQDRVVEAGHLLGAEQHQGRVQRHRGERAHGHRVAAAGGDDHDAAGELAHRVPEGGLVDAAARRLAHWGRAPAARIQRPNDRATPSRTLTVPPYRYHLPGVVSVMITLPFATGLDSTNDARIQPTAG